MLWLGLGVLEGVGEGGAKMEENMFNPLEKRKEQKKWGGSENGRGGLVGVGGVRRVC